MVSFVNDLECFDRKQKLKIDCNFQFLILRLPPKTEKLSHVTDCNIVGKANAAQFQFFSSFLIGLKQKYKLCFNILPKGKKNEKFSIGHFRIFMIENNDNRKLNQFSIFDLKRN